MSAIAIALSVAILLESALIAALLYERRQRRREQLAVSESGERSEIAGVSLGVGFWTWEPESDRIWTSRQCAWLLGWEAREGRTLDQLLGALRSQTGGFVENAFERAVRSGTPFDGEWPVAHRDEALRWIAAATCPSIDAHGRRHVTGVLMDVTARKNAELIAAEQRRELSHLSRVAMLGEMSGTLAHELKQPLTAILNYAQGARRFIDRDRPDLDRARQSLDAIVKAERHAGSVIDRMRAFLKRRDSPPETLDVNEVVRETLELASGELRSRAIVPVTQLATNLPRAFCDRIQIQQVLVNLILNACDAMNKIAPASRRLEVTTLHDQGRIRLVVRDSGTGIALEDVNRVFDPFVTSKPDGLGLGLSICRSIVRAHGGEIVASNNRGSGSTFEVSLPPAPGPAAYETRRSSSRTSAATESTPSLRVTRPR